MDGTKNAITSNIDLNKESFLKTRVFHGHVAQKVASNTLKLGNQYMMEANSYNKNLSTVHYSFFEHIDDR